MVRASWLWSRAQGPLHSIPFHSMPFHAIPFHQAFTACLSLVRPTEKYKKCKMFRAISKPRRWLEDWRHVTPIAPKGPPQLSTMSQTTCVSFPLSICSRFRFSEILASEAHNCPIVFLGWKYIHPNRKSVLHQAWATFKNMQVTSKNWNLKQMKNIEVVRCSGKFNFFAYTKIDLEYLLELSGGTKTF